MAYCQNALRDKHRHLVRAQRVNDNTLVHLAWAIREQQQSREGHFLPHAQRYLEELKDLFCGANIVENNGAFERAVDPAPLPPE